MLLDEKRAVAEIIAFAEARSGSALLRVYWYDASSSQGPNADHIRLAETDDVKLRLGTLNTFGQQKGVDSLMIADLIELARNGAIESAVVISGDDDLRVGVQVAQTFGIRVHLLGIAGSDGEAQSKLLVREADTCSRWTKADVAKFLSLREPAVVVTRDPGTATGTKTPQESDGADTSGDTTPTEVSATLRATCRRFLDALQSTDLVDIKTVYDATHKVPYQYDKRLLASARTELGRDLSVTESRALRNVFVEELAVRLPEPNGATSS
ncbi:MAG TPA: NYN domain-containing protein [Candidatus Elarobacter sp.]